MSHTQLTATTRSLSPPLSSAKHTQARAQVPPRLERILTAVCRRTRSNSTAQSFARWNTRIVMHCFAKFRGSVVTREPAGSKPPMLQSLIHPGTGCRKIKSLQSIVLAGPYPSQRNRSKSFLEMAITLLRCLSPFFETSISVVFSTPDNKKQKDTTSRTRCRELRNKWRWRRRNWTPTVFVHSHGPTRPPVQYHSPQAGSSEPLRPRSHECEIIAGRLASPHQHLPSFLPFT
jgi:hypothetical protein